MMKKNDFEFAGISEEEVRGMFFDIPRRPTAAIDPYDGQTYGYEDDEPTDTEFENLGFSVFSF